MSTAGTVVTMPTTADEPWRYTPVDEIVARLTAASTATQATGVTVTPTVVDSLAGRVDGPRLVFVNGKLDAQLSEQGDRARGVWLGIADPDREPTVKATTPAGDELAINGFLVQNHEAGNDIALVIVDAGVRSESPVHIVHIAVPGDHDGRTNALSSPRTIVEVGEGSHLAVVETYCGLDGSTVTNASTTIRIADEGELDHCRIQIESPHATHIGHTRVEPGSGSQLRMSSITIGADIARNAIDVDLEAPGAQVELLGINKTTGRQRHDTVVMIDHAASRCASNQRFAGVVDDHGQSSFSGEIIVRPGTVATNAHQSNRNLVLDPRAEADTRPWLRILADDVACTHGATVGRLDDEALFYLRSRGIAFDDARTMLIDAFISDIVDTIRPDAVRAHVTDIIATSTDTGTEAPR